jgi:hypothetical protein
MISPPTLHPPILETADDFAAIAEALTSLTDDRQLAIERPSTHVTQTSTIEIPLSTISRNYNFDALIHLRFVGAPDSRSPCLWSGFEAPGNPAPCLLVDSGNSSLIVPDFACIEKLSNFNANYQVLSKKDVPEPFGCPAKLVKGPIEILSRTKWHRIENCVFYACTGLNRENKRTANFGLGWISPPWPTTVPDFPTVLPPLAYDTTYPYVEVSYAPATAVLAGGRTLRVDGQSALVLRKQGLDDSYHMFDIIRELDWMSVSVRSLSIGATRTDWPEVAVPGQQSPIAMIDTGGGPVFLSDPTGKIYAKHWPSQVPCPAWTADGSIACQAIQDPLTIELGQDADVFSYRIDTKSLPESVRGLTLVMCEDCSYMRRNTGMNIGGISALFNHILIDYRQGRVGFKTKGPAFA